MSDIMDPERFQRNESGRLTELHQLAILDTPDERVYDNLTQLASEICEAPIALISLVDAERNWFKSRVGCIETESTRDASFCSHVIESSMPLVVEDATIHPDFKDKVYVAAEDGWRSYAGIPLITSKGFAIGALCVIDYSPRKFTELQLTCLERLAHQVVVLIKQRRINLHLAEVERKSFESEQRLTFAVDAADIGDWSMDSRATLNGHQRERYQMVKKLEASCSTGAT